MTTRFPVAVDDPLRNAGWQPGRWDIRQAEQWADSLRAHLSPAGHRHAVFPAAVEVWAEFGNLHITPTDPGRHVAPTPVHIDPLPGLHAARTLSDLGRALGTEICPLGTEGEGEALLVIDAERRVYSLDPTGDWYLGPDFDSALSALLMGLSPARLSIHGPDPLHGGDSVAPHPDEALATAAADGPVGAAGTDAEWGAESGNGAPAGAAANAGDAANAGADGGAGAGPWEPAAPATAYSAYPTYPAYQDITGAEADAVADRFSGLRTE